MLIAARRGDQEAAYDFYKGACSVLVKFLYVPWGDAEDLVQEVIIKALDPRQPFINMGRTAAWLRQLARRELVRRRRAAVWALESLKSYPQSADCDPGSDELIQRLQAALKEAIDGLDEKHRDAIVLRERGRSIREISMLLGRPERTIKHHLRTGRTRIALYLKGHYPEVYASYEWYLGRFLEVSDE